MKRWQRQSHLCRFRPSFLRSFRQRSAIAGFLFVLLSVFALSLALISSLMIGSQTAHAQSGLDQCNLPSGARTWPAAETPSGNPGYLRELEAYQSAPDGSEITFYANKNIWLFGTGDMLLLEWIPCLENGSSVFRVQFAFLDQSEVEALAAGTRLEEQALFTTTSDLFTDQSGLYEASLVSSRSLRAILLDPDETPELGRLLDTKYPNNQAAKARVLSLYDDLALDMQIYPPSGRYTNTQQVAVYLPGYEPGLPGNNSTSEGWNSVISMGKDPELWMNAQGLGYQDMRDGDRRWGVLIGWNTHLDTDGQQTPSKGMMPDENNYIGLISGNSGQIGLLQRAMAALDSEWAGVPLQGQINVVSHSTGYYLAREFLHQLPAFATPSILRNFALSPNIRGSTMIGHAAFGQAYDSMDDMYRDNWHGDGGYRLNATTRTIAQMTVPPGTESYIMLAYGDTASPGTGGSFAGLRRDPGVVDYSNYQPFFEDSIESLDDEEYGRRKRFAHYEALYNLCNDGGPLNKTFDLAEWENGGDAHLAALPGVCPGGSGSSTKISIFNGNIHLMGQGADDGDFYTDDHSDFAQRMAAVKRIVNDQQVNLQPEAGKPLEVRYSEVTPGSVEFFWLPSGSEVGMKDDKRTRGSMIDGQLYEVTRHIEGGPALADWEDKWPARVALQPVYDDNDAKTCEETPDGCRYQSLYHTFERIQAAESFSSDQLWIFSERDEEIADVKSIDLPAWNDGAFDEKELWVRVQSGPLEGKFCQVKQVQDYVGIGFDDRGALTSTGVPFPPKTRIMLMINRLTCSQQPEEDDLITLGGIRYLYNAAFWAPVMPLVKEVDNNRAMYTHDEEKGDKLLPGHFFSVNREEPISHETDTIAPLITFGELPE